MGQPKTDEIRTLDEDRAAPAEATIAVFVAVIGATALAAGLGTAVSGGEQDAWYASLNKAPGTPPGFVFGLVWPVLYGLMALGACLVWLAGRSWRRTRAALQLYFVQLVLNVAWSWLFFGYNLAWAALANIVVLWVVTFLMTRAFGQHSGVAAILQYPYLAWLAFAAYLNAWIAIAN